MNQYLLKFGSKLLGSIDVDGVFSVSVSRQFNGLFWVSPDRTTKSWSRLELCVKTKSVDSPTSPALATIGWMLRVVRGVLIINRSGFSV